jgi:glucosyl-dolichyl phosphate glucuronosyltransferase
MDVSVVVCTYNRAASLRDTLEALDAQVTPAHLEWDLLVVDNNSTDGTPAVVQDFTVTARVPVQHLRVSRPGLSRSRNEGLARAGGSIVAFTDDDVCPARDWVASIAAAMHQASADMLGGRIVPAWDHAPPAWLADRPALHHALTVLDHDRFAVVVTATQLPTIWGANMAFRRQVFDRVGGFDTRRGVRGTKLYRGEELDLVARALAVGCRAVYDPRVVVRHRVWAHRMRVSYVSRLYIQRAEGEALVQEPLAARHLLAANLAVVVRGCRWIRSLVGRRPDTLDRWLDACASVGHLRGTWLRHLSRFATRLRTGMAPWRGRASIADRPSVSCPAGVERARARVAEKSGGDE